MNLLRILLKHRLPGVILLLALSGLAQAATITVTTAGDAGGGCTLRQAVESANNNAAVGTCTAGTAGADTIQFAPALSSPITITLNGTDLPIREELTISGPVANNPTGVTIDANQLSRVMSVINATPLTLNNLTLTRGKANNDVGGAVYSGGSSVTLNYVTVSNSQASDNGGGIYSDGTVTLNNSTVSGNSSGRSGGGIYAGNLSLTNSTVSGNRAGRDIGGMNSGGTATLTNSTVSGNSAQGRSGGMEAAKAVLIHSTITNNTAQTGGGLTLWANNGQNNLFRLVGTLLSGNSAQTNASLSIANSSSTYTLEAQNSLLGNDVDDARANYTFTNQGGNVFSDSPNLAALSNNGGSTQTMLPNTGSPAINAAGNCTATVTTDQRGVTRPQDLVCDIGAVEVQGFTLSVTTSGTGTVSAGGSPTPLQGAISNCSTSPAAGTCSAFYAPGANVTLSASPVAGHRFSTWGSSPCTNSNPDGTGTCTVTLSQARSVSATFVQIINGACGSANGQTRTSAPSTAAELCTTGTPGAVTGTWNWSCNGANGGTSATCSASIQTYSVNLTIAPPGAGTAHCTPSTVPHGGGSTCSIDTTSTGYTFNQWGGHCSGATCSLTSITATQNVTANFTANSYNLNYNGNNNTGGSAPAGSTPAYNSTVTVSGNTGNLVRTGFVYMGWNTAADGSGTSYAAGSTFPMPPNALTLYAQWMSANSGPYTVGGTVLGLSGSGLVLQNNGGDNLAITGNGNFTFTTALTTGSGYAVTVLTQPGNPIQTCSVSNGTGTVGNTNITNITLNCAANAYAITTAVNPTEGGSITCTPNPIPQGGNATCTATPKPGYTFSGWSGDCTGPGVCTLTNVTSAKSVTANFTQAVQKTYTGPTATGTGNATATVSGGGDNCGFTSDARFVPLSSVAAAPPVGYSFPHGLFKFTLTQCTVGSTVTLSIRYPATLPEGTRYWKYGPTPNQAEHWYLFSQAAMNGDTVTFNLTDGGLGDNDLKADGTISDPSGPAVPATDIPTLSEWAFLALLMGLLTLSGGRLSRKPTC